MRNPAAMNRLPAVLSILIFGAASLQAGLRLPALFTDHMVLQRGVACPVWGWDEPGTKVTVAFGGQQKSAVAGDNGRWETKLDALEASAAPRTLKVTGQGAIEVNDVLVGDVWVGSGQSNMQFKLGQTWDGDLEALMAANANLRLITVPIRGTQKLEPDFQGAWAVSSPESAPDFSAVLYFFGRHLQQTLGVPVGLIHCSWGGSACEAWVPRAAIESDPRFAALVDGWRKREAGFDEQAERAKHEAAMKEWRQKATEARQAGKPAPQAPRFNNPLGGNQRPGNLWAGMAHPIKGYGIRGAIWYQGESNAGRAAQYRDLFPFMIEQWRKQWGQGDFPFYWVQLADYQGEPASPGDSAWAELREAQTLTLDKLPKTGQAVIIDLGEAGDIHPRNKRDVAERLVRWALAGEFGRPIACQSPRFQTLRAEGNKIILTFGDVGGGLRTVDKKEVQGFAICGADRKWVWAEAKIAAKDRIVVTSPQVGAPVAVRYAWADNPVCNVYSAEGLPLTPFRTDDFPLTTAGK